MSTTETLFAGKAPKVEANTSPKALEPRSSTEDPRFTEELRASRADEKRVAEDRARAKQADQARVEEARTQDARTQEARAAEARAEDARAEDARDDAAREDRSREEKSREETEASASDSESDETSLTDVTTSGTVNATVDEILTAAAHSASPTNQTGQTDEALLNIAVEETVGDQTAGNKAAGNALPGAQATGDAASTAASSKAQHQAAANVPAQAATSTAGLPHETAQKAATSTTEEITPAQLAKQAGTPTDIAKGPVEAEAALAAQAGSAGPKRGLGHAAAASMSDNKADTKSDTTASAKPATTSADTSGNADKPSTVQAAQRSAASEIALQAALGKTATGTQDIRVAGLDAPSNAGSAPQSAEGTAPAPSVTVRAIMSATAQPGTPVQPQTPAREIAINMARNLGNGTNRFEIRLDPAELGRIDVRMEVNADGRVQAHLTVEKPETLEMLQRDARSLEKALADAGLDMDQSSLGYSLRDDGDSNNFAMNREAAEAASGKDTPEDELAADLAAVQHVYSLKAGSGSGVDIRI